MAKKLPDIQVLIPYKTLQELLSASDEVRSLRLETKQLREQQAALRLQFVELMERLKELT